MLYRFLIPVALLSFACTPPGEEAFAAAVVTSALQTDSPGALARDAGDTVDCELDGVRAAAHVASHESRHLSPASCIVKTATDATVHAELNECAGLFKRAVLSGGVDASFEVNAECQLVVDIDDSGDLIANGSSLDFNAQGVVELNGDQRLAEWTREFTGTSVGGRSVHRTANVSVVVDRATGCRTLDGDAEGTVDEHSFESTVSGLAVCPGTCPSAGTIHATRHGRRDHSLTIIFDGSALARVDGWSGKPFDVELDCEGAE